MMSGGGGGYREPVKVVIINTKYVETDATSFKAVVQKLTGNDSESGSDSDEGKGKGYTTNYYNYNNDQKKPCERKRSINASSSRNSVVGGGGRGGVEAVLMRDLSFKEFDMLLRDMPTIDELMANY